MEWTLARSQKPFLVEVKRGRRGAVAAPLTVAPKPPEAALRAAAEASFAPPREPAKPPRRILDAIEPEPVVLEEAPVLVDPLKRRRGRPPKIAGAPPSPKKQRPAVAPRGEASVVAVKRREHPPVASVKPERETKIALRPQGQGRGKSEGRVAPSQTIQGDATYASAIAASASQSSASHGHLTHGHVTHGDRVEAATTLPRGERWKRRLPKVLW
jgi:hypothetical protein